VTDLGEFLLARIAEDEAAARTASGDGGRNWQSVSDGYEEFGWTVGPGRTEGAGVYRYVVTDQAQAGHLARWDPARVLAECDAKRRIVVSCQEMQTAVVPTAAYLATVTLRNLALPYADHQSYREEWRP
jgi:hypothetical protein